MGGGPGTNNPCSVDEYFSMVANGTWSGGYVWNVGNVSTSDVLIQSNGFVGFWTPTSSRGEGDLYVVRDGQRQLVKSAVYSSECSALLRNVNNSNDDQGECHVVLGDVYVYGSADGYYTTQSYYGSASDLIDSVISSKTDGYVATIAKQILGEIINLIRIPGVQALAKTKDVYNYVSESQCNTILRIANEVLRTGYNGPINVVTNIIDPYNGSYTYYAGAMGTIGTSTGYVTLRRYVIKVYNANNGRLILTATI